MRPPTLNIFPSKPMHSGHPSSNLTSTSKASDATAMLSPLSNCREGAFGLSNNDILSNPNTYAPEKLVESSKAIKREGIRKERSSTAGQDHCMSPDSKEDNRKGPSSTAGQDHRMAPDSKTLRRLAQNREAARKSRLRKKAYVQQLETSNIKLTQLEHELKKAKAQGVILDGVGHISAEAAAFNMDYAKWLEDYRLHTGRLQDAVEKHLSDNEIRIYVDNCIAHFDDLMHRKCLIVKADVFHILSGMWKTPAERCFMWIGGFRPSELIKIIPGQIQPLTQQQYVGIFDFQQSIVEAEEMLSQDLETMNQSLSQIVSENLNYPKDMANYMGQMAASMEKLSNLEVIVHRADNLRLQTIHRMHDLMTTRQASRSLIAIGEFFHRLQSLSLVWGSRDPKS